MFDLKLVRDNPEFVRAGIRKKHRDPALVDAALDIDRRRRELLQDVERYRADQNRASKRRIALPRCGRSRRG